MVVVESPLKFPQFPKEAQFLVPYPVIGIEVIAVVVWPAGDQEEPKVRSIVPLTVQGEGVVLTVVEAAVGVAILAILTKGAAAVVGEVAVDVVEVAVIIVEASEEV